MQLACMINIYGPVLYQICISVSLTTENQHARVVHVAVPDLKLFALLAAKHDLRSGDMVLVGYVRVDV